ncbi:MAG: hypothetical protein U0324_39785 [Polyangiales bacterium]
MRPRRGPPALGALLSLALACSPVPDEPVVAPATCSGQPRSRCVRSVSVGARFACAALHDQTVWCWGRNDESQLGYESADLCPERLADGRTRAVACHAAPLQVLGLAGVVALSAGGAHTCARRADGTLRCWGANGSGQLGNGAVLPSRTPVAVALGGVVSVASGDRHTCAVTQQGSVYCWGANDRGQLGLAESPSACGPEGQRVPCARTPTRVTSVEEAVEVVAGDAHTCARTRRGRVWCWGANGDGELGANTASDRATPEAQAVLVGAHVLVGATSLAAGASHTCATRDDGAVLCWGRHERGQLGVAVPGSFAPCAHACIRTAVPIAGFEGAPLPEDPDGSVDSGLPDVSNTADVRRPDSAVDASADDANDVEDADKREAAPEPPPPAAVAVAAGSEFSCLSLDDGTVRCWGSNRAYELGNGRGDEGGAALTTVIASPGAAATNPLQEVVGVEAGAQTACAVLANRAVRCWGSNELGALGVGSTAEQHGPVPVTW